MINTWSELVAAFKIWIETPIKLKKNKLPEPSEYAEILNRPTPPHGDYPASFDKTFLPNYFDRDNMQQHRIKIAKMMHESSRQFWDDKVREIRDYKGIAWCNDCKNAGCDKCSIWPME